MAYTEIHAIIKSLSETINYGTADKTKLINDDDIRGAIPYMKKDVNGNTVIYKTTTSTIGCNVETADAAFTYIRDLHNGRKRLNRETLKGGENIAFHCIQSFAEKIEAKTANEIGKKLAEECFQLLFLLCFVFLSGH